MAVDVRPAGRAERRDLAGLLVAPERGRHADARSALQQPRAAVRLYLTQNIYCFVIGSQLPDIIVSLLFLITKAAMQMRAQPFNNLAQRSVFVSHHVVLKSFCKNQFPHKSFNLAFVLVMITNKLMDFWRELTFAK